MQKPNKKMAAAIAAVNLYLQEEQAMAEAAANEAAAMASRCSSEASQWVFSSRLDTMTSNRMVQMRAFSGVR